VGQQEKLFVGMILILIFAEALGLYGTCRCDYDCVSVVVLDLQSRVWSTVLTRDASFSSPPPLLLISC
jgi:hypothetical protein